MRTIKAPGSAAHINTQMAGEPSFSWTSADAQTRYQPPEAFLCLVSLAAAADGNVAVLESEWLQLLTRRWWGRGVVREQDVVALNYAVCARMDRGQDVALAEAAAALPAPYRLPVYAQALDVMLINGPLNAAEEAFAGELAHALGLDAQDAADVRASIALKNSY